MDAHDQYPDQATCQLNPKKIHSSTDVTFFIAAIVTTMAGRKNESKNPEGSDKNSINTFVTADPVAAGKRQEANSRSTVLCWRKFKRRKSSPYIRKKTEVR